MEKREKVEYILEQMRLCLAKRDFVRMQIISKKISVKFFEDNKEQVIFIKKQIVHQKIDCPIFPCFSMYPISLTWHCLL